MPLSCASQFQDTMEPQAIVEEEELERLNALLRRESLIRSMGIVEQISSIMRCGQPSQSRPDSPVRGSTQHLSERGPRAVLARGGGCGPGGSWDGIWLCRLRKESFGSCHIRSQAPLFLALVSSQVQLPTFSQGTGSLHSHLAITPPSAALAGEKSRADEAAAGIHCSLG